MTVAEFRAKYEALYQEVFQAGASKERERVVELLGWDQSEDVRAIVNTAIIEGKTQNNVLAQLTKAVGTKQAEVVQMGAENAPGIASSGSEKTEDEIAKADVAAILASAKKQIKV